MIAPVPVHCFSITFFAGRKVILYVLSCYGSNYEKMPIQYTVIFQGHKNDYFQMKNSNIFPIFAQNIDCGYTLEPSH